MRKMVQHFGAEFEAWNELSLEMLAQEQQDLCWQRFAIFRWLKAEVYLSPNS